jgi:hypothetical protein
MEIMSMIPNALTLINTTIRQDAEGRYCLNDLHQAAGGANRHRPSLWLANKQAQALIAEMDSEQEFLLRNPVATVATGSPVTYVVKELVYAYAMWISPAFHLKVIRAYDAMVTEEIESAELNARVNQRYINRSKSYWFAKRPQWRLIHQYLDRGWGVRQIAQAIGKSVSAVRRAIGRMVEIGLLDPVDIGYTDAQRQLGSSIRQRYPGWGRETQQLDLFRYVDYRVVRGVH